MTIFFSIYKHIFYVVDISYIVMSYISLLFRKMYHFYFFDFIQFLRVLYGSGGYNLAASPAILKPSQSLSKISWLYLDYNLSTDLKFCVDLLITLKIIANFKKKLEHF